jgi:phosphoribosylformylglycinamidine synthase
MIQLYRNIDKGLDYGFYIESTNPLSSQDLVKIRWLIGETFEPNKVANVPHVGTNIEIGPRLSIETPYSSNAVAICHAMRMSHITRIERTKCFSLDEGQSAEELLSLHMDRMTQQQYVEVNNFNTGIVAEPVKIVDLINHGAGILEDVNKTLGLGMDARDIEFYYNLFVNTLKRNPTDVELFQLGNANSEHSRHWYFKGQIIIDGTPMPKTLFEVVQSPLQQLHNQQCSLIYFRDNAGVIRGFETDVMVPLCPGKPSEMIVKQSLLHIACTAETHNHPTAVSPFSGAQTGTGGRIRDNSAVGRGAYSGIGAAGYFVGNLFIPGYRIPGEIIGADKKSKYASPLSILIEGSNGISSYNNEIGEPVTLGFTRSFGQEFDREWREPRKPILYSAGVSHINNEHLEKTEPQIGMLIVAIGGPGYPIGVGGGSASSMIQGQNTDALDYSSVQRGDAAMENGTNRIIRTCVEMGINNPIASIHDQGAGGPSNVLTELLEPLGGVINIRNIVLGDKSMSVLQIWSAEFQERYGLLIRLEHIGAFSSICKREGRNCEVLGEITGNGKVVVHDPVNNQTPVDLNLEQILTNMPQKKFETNRHIPTLQPFVFPEMTLREAIQNVFKLLSVGSKGFLVHKADRSVTGLVAQQQCCGIAQIAISDASINAQSHFGLTGSVSAIGEQPIKMLINPKAGARMAVAEMLLNMSGVKIRSLQEIRCRANWIWPAKMPKEGALMYDAATAMADFMIELGKQGIEIAIDGGKDSLSPVANVQGEHVKSPGSLIIYGYAPVPDITKKITPDIKKPGESKLALIDLGSRKNRMGGSAFAQSLNQVGDETPDVDDPGLLGRVFTLMQHLIDEDLILACHDRSDGGLITTISEMCMASRCGFNIRVFNSKQPLAELFSEELGLVLEISNDKEYEVNLLCTEYNVPLLFLGRTVDNTGCMIIDSRSQMIFRSTIMEMRSWWEQTSFEIEKLQMNPDCATEEYLEQSEQHPSISSAPSYRLSFTPHATDYSHMDNLNNPRVAVLRADGTNSDVEMRAACLMAGLNPVDVSMTDLLNGTIDLDSFQGVINAGGFSFMDVFGSAKGWAGTILFNPILKEMFQRFYDRPDTFTLGVCNGCQLDALLGVVPYQGIPTEKQPRFIGNTSGRFESRWVQVEILKSPSILLQGMEGSKLGIWSAHGEGKLFFPDQVIQQQVHAQHLAPIRYIDPLGKNTESYPYNPNGSPFGIAALCSPDGRHLSMMPHPERCVLKWQWPWMPAEWNMEASPWLRMFQNARAWCISNKV